jgi:predicted RNA-binding protein with PUA-like domain
MRAFLYGFEISDQRRRNFLRALSLGNTVVFSCSDTHPNSFGVFVFS